MVKIGSKISFSSMSLPFIQVLDRTPFLYSARWTNVLPLYTLIFSINVGFCHAFMITYQSYYQGAWPCVSSNKQENPTSRNLTRRGFSCGVNSLICQSEPKHFRKNTPVHWGNFYPIKQECSLAQQKTFIGLNVSVPRKQIKYSLV